jgi:hypothetical protein
MMMATTCCSQEDVLAMEIPLLEGLQFDLIVHLPYNPLHGFIIDLKVPPTLHPQIFAARAWPGGHQFADPSLDG